jgi:hypothetical protein
MRKAVSLLFVIGALYDGILGLVFLIVPRAIFEFYEVAPPNHFGYVQFPALLLIVFAIMFLHIAVDPVANRKLIPYGIMLKVAYCGCVAWYWVTTGVPDMWKPFAIADLIFGVLFWLAYLRMGRETG